MKLNFFAGTDVKNYEYAREFYNFLSRHNIKPKEIKNHYNEYFFKKDSIYIYTVYIPKHKVVNTINIDSQYSLTGEEVFFDGSAKFHQVETIEGVTFKATKILYGGNFIGYYLHKLNSFFLTDITHLDYSDFWEDLIFLFSIIEVYKKQKKPTKKDVEIKIGCDIEYITKDLDGNYIAGDELGTLDSKIGRDGWTAITELRPDPADTPKQLVENIQKLYQEVANRGYFLTTYTSNTYPLGSHIHIGLYEKNKGYFKYILTEEELTFYHDFYGSFVKKLNYRNKWTQKKYWFKPKTYGFEYRLPASSIAYTKEFMRINFKIFKNLFIYYHRQKEEIYNIYAPTAEEVKEFYIKNKILTQKEADYFFTTLDKVEETNIFKQWRIKKRIRPYFMGSFPPEIKEELIKKYTVSRGKPHYFIILHERRGDFINETPTEEAEEKIYKIANSYYDAILHFIPYIYKDNLEVITEKAIIREV